MRTIRIKLYKFSELSEDAKQKAIEDYRNSNTEIFWAAENRDTLKAFESLFPIDIRNWSYGGRGEGVSFSMTCEDTIEDLTGQRLATYLWNNYRMEIYTPKEYWICNGMYNCVGVNAKHRKSKVQLYDKYNCPLTGYCMDNEILDPIYTFIDKPTNINFKELMDECFEAWIKACNADIDYQNSDEYIIDNIEANEYEFTKEGKLN